VELGQDGVVPAAQAQGAVGQGGGEAGVAPVQALGVEQGRHFYICHRKDQYLTHYMVELIRLLKPDFELPRSEEFSES